MWTSDVTCQTTGRCVRRPASGMKRNPCWGSQITILKGHAPFFSSFRVVRPTQFFGIIKNKKKIKKKTRKQEKRNGKVEPLINSFNFKYEHYNNISRHKRFGGVSFLLWNRPPYFPPYWVCFALVTHVLFRLCGRRLELVGARKNGARERDTRISSRARSLSRPTSKCLLHSYMSRCFQAPP